MEKLATLLKLSHKFTKNYIKQYFKMLIKPCLVGLLGFLFLPLCFLNPIFCVFALVITLPCLFYAFWRGFCITYLLNYAALNFLKGTPDLELKSYENSFQATESGFMKYISFCAFVSIILYFPFIFLIAKDFAKMDITNYFSLFSNNLSTFLVFLITTILLIPFLNYFTQSYFFKKDYESYFDAFLNCYKKLDATGLIIAVSIILTTFIISSLGSIFTPLLIILNLYFYSINTFWYYSKASQL